MKSLSHIAARHLEQIIFVEFLEHASFDFDELCEEIEKLINYDPDERRVTHMKKKKRTNFNWRGRGE